MKSPALARYRAPRLRASFALLVCLCGTILLMASLNLDVIEINSTPILMLGSRNVLPESSQKAGWTLSSNDPAAALAIVEPEAACKCSAVTVSLRVDGAFANAIRQVTLNNKARYRMSARVRRRDGRAIDAVQFVVTVRGVPNTYRPTGVPAPSRTGWFQVSREFDELTSGLYGFGVSGAAQETLFADVSLAQVPPAHVAKWFGSAAGVLLIVLGIAAYPAGAAAMLMARPTASASRGDLVAPLSRTQRVVAIGIANVVVLSIGLGALEILYRVRARVDTRLWTYHIQSRELGWVFRKDLDNLDIQDANGIGPPGMVLRLRTNSLGLRDTPEPSDIPAEALVIAVQGDSNIAGYGMQPPETFSAQLQRVLSIGPHGTTARPPVVLNWGISGYDTNQYVLQLQMLRQRYRVDETVMVFNLGNDFASALTNTYFAPRPYFRPSGTDVRLESHAVPMYEQSYPHRFIPDYASYDHLIAPLNRDRFLIPEGPLGYSRAFVETLRTVYARGWLRKPVFFALDLARADAYSPYGPEGGTWSYLRTTPEPYASYEGVLASLLRQWSRAAPEGWIVLLPDKVQLCRDLQQKHASRAEAVGLGAVNFDRPTERMIRLAHEAQVRVIDPLPRFKEAPEGCGSLYLGDGHLSARGHELLARVVGEALAQQ